MRVKVKLYATLARFANGIRAGFPFEVELADGATVSDLVTALQIPQEETKIAFVNGIIQPVDCILNPGDEVGIFPPVGGGSMEEIIIDTWLYGELAQYGGPDHQAGFANIQAQLPAGSAMGDLLSFLQMPTEERGITFINGQLSSMPGLQPDLGHILHDGDRIAFFHLRSMWPFQYRFGVPMIPEMTESMHGHDEGSLHHSYE